MGSEERAPEGAELDLARTERDRLRAETENLQVEIARRLNAQHGAEVRYRALFERAEAGLAAVGLNGVIIEANPSFARLAGVADPADLRHTRFAAYTHVDDRARDEDILTALALGARSTAWIRKRRPDGSRAFHLYHVSRDDGGRPSAIVVRDASELSDLFHGAIDAPAVARGEIVGAGTLLARTVAEAQGPADRAGVGLALVGPEDLPAVACDPEALALALRYVVQGVVAAAPAGAAVVLQARPEDGVLLLVVAAEGDPPPAPPAEGLSLEIARAVVEAHGGSIDELAGAVRVSLPIRG